MSLYTKNKIYLIFSGIGFFFLLFGFLLLNQSMTIKRFSDEIDKIWIPGIIEINALNATASDYRFSVAQYVISTDLNEREEIEQTMLQLTDEIATKQSKYEPTIASDKEHTLYQKMLKSYESYLAASKQALLFSKNNDPDKAAAQFRLNRSLFATFNNDLQNLVELNNKGSTDAAEQGSKVFAQAKVLIIIGSILTVVVIGFFAWALGRAKLNHHEVSVREALKRKISLSFLVIMVVFLAFSGLFYQQLARVNQQLTELNGNWIPSIIAINALNTKISDYRVTEALSVLSVNDDEMSQWDQKFKTLITGIGSLRNQYAALISSASERNLYAEFSSGFEEYIAASKQTTDFIRNKERAKANLQLKQSGILFTDFRSLLAELVDLNQHGGINNSRTVDAALQSLKIITIGGEVFNLLLLTIIALLVQSWLLDEPLSHTDGENYRPTLTIKLKLRLAFLGMVATFILFSLLINGLMQVMNEQARELEKNWVPSIIVINSLNTMISDYRNAEVQQIATANEMGKLLWDKKIKRLANKMAKAREFYQSLIASEEERSIYQNVSDKFDNYLSKSEAMLTLSRNHDIDKAKAELQHNRIQYYALTANLLKLVDLNSVGGMRSAHLSQRIFEEAQQTIFSVVLAIFMLAILFMIVFDKNISVALQRLTAMMLRLAEGSINNAGGGDINKRRDEIGQMANALSVVTQTLQTLASDAIELSDAAQSGILSARVDAKRHPGEFGRIVAGMNSLIQVLSQPLAEVAQIMQNVALGDLDSRMTGDYEGELRILKTNVNRSLDALVNLLTELSAFMEHMAHADLTQTLDGNYQGEFSVLKANTNQTIAQLITILREIIDSTSQSAVAITQTSESSKYVAEESARQMLALENVFGTIEETAISVHEVAKKTKESSELASATASSAKNGQLQLNKLIELIQHIDAEYGRIEKITDEITRIADKTHLLSLNAGLEAMRAGDHGLGFGFVAQQIGQLAEEVSVSARDIGGVINSSGQKIRLGVHAMQETQVAMEQIAEDAQTSQNNVEHISVAIVQQSAAVKLLTERVNEIRASSEASAAASEEISTTMIHLAETVRDTAAYAKRFKLVED